MILNQIKIIKTVDEMLNVVRDNQLTPMEISAVQGIVNVSLARTVMHNMDMHELKAKTNGGPSGKPA